MKKLSRQKLIAGILAAVGLLILVVVLFIHASGIGNDAPSSKLPRPVSQAPQINPPEKLPRIQRALVVDIPLAGRLQGVRWITDHKFQTLRPEDYRKGPLVDRGLDVLVDAEENFLAARFNGEQFVTKPPEASFKNLLRYATFNALKTAEESSPKVPEIMKVEPAKLRWDDPNLGDCIRKLINRSYRFHKADALTRYEETYYAVSVWYAGEASPRNIVVRRYTDGLAEGGAPFPPNGIPQDVGGAIRNSNRYGASVISLAWEIGSPRDSRDIISLLYLTEPWTGPCPWPSDKLDPYYGDNRLNEFVMPPEFSSGEMPDLFDWAPNTRDPAEHFKLQAEKNKADRLAMEPKHPSGR